MNGISSFDSSNDSGLTTPNLDKVSILPLHLNDIHQLIGFPKIVVVVIVSPLNAPVGQVWDSGESIPDLVPPPNNEGVEFTIGDASVSHEPVPILS